MKYALTVALALAATPVASQTLDQTLDQLGRQLQSLQDNLHHPPQDQALHDKFYSTWMMPTPRNFDGNRVNSCCNNVDCYPTTFKRAGGTWFARQRETGRWIVVPDERLEQNQPDPRESPDGRGHLCANANGVVYCAVIGLQG